MKKTLVSGLVTLTAVATLASVPAQAKPMHYGHGGGFGWGAAGLIGGLALGGAIAASAAATPVYECGTVRQTVVDRWGNLIGYRYVSAC